MEILHRKNKTGFLLVAVIMLVSCQNTANSSENNSMDSAQSLNNTKFPASPSKQEHAQYLMKAYGNGLYEIRASQAAMKQSSNKEVKKLAASMVKDHTTLNQQINDLASKKQINLPGNISQEQQKNLNTLLAEHGPGFDKDYIRQMVNGHKNTIVLLNQAIKNSGPDIINWADKTLPAIQAHLNMATTCQNELDSLQKR